MSRHIPYTRADWERLLGPKWDPDDPHDLSDPIPVHGPHDSPGLVTRRCSCGYRTGKGDPVTTLKAAQDHQRGCREWQALRQRNSRGAEG